MNRVKIRDVSKIVRAAAENGYEYSLREVIIALAATEKKVGKVSSAEELAKWLQRIEEAEREKEEKNYIRVKLEPAGTKVKYGSGYTVTYPDCATSGTTDWNEAVSTAYTTSSWYSNTR